MSILDVVRQQAQREVSQNQGPAQTHNWPDAVRQSYEAERTRLQNPKK